MSDEKILKLQQELQAIKDSSTVAGKPVDPKVKIGTLVGLATSGVISAPLLLTLLEHIQRGEGWAIAVVIILAIGPTILNFIFSYQFTDPRWQKVSDAFEEAVRGSVESNS